MTNPEDRENGARRAWDRLLDLLAREVVRRLRKEHAAVDVEDPPGGEDGGRSIKGGDDDAR